MNDTTTEIEMIKVEGLEKSFGSLNVLKGIDITIYKGDVVAVIGPSGGGKSTFIRCLNCLEDPTGGRIYFGGEDIADFKVDINVHRQKMGMVFQQFNLFDNKNVLDNITLAPMKILWKNKKKELGLHWYQNECKVQKKAFKEETVANAHRLLERIGLDDKAESFPSTLSGG